MKSYNPELIEGLTPGTRTMSVLLAYLMTHYVIAPIAIAWVFGIAWYIPFVMLVVYGGISKVFVLYLKSKVLEARYDG